MGYLFGFVMEEKEEWLNSVLFLISSSHDLCFGNSPQIGNTIIIYTICYRIHMSSKPFIQLPDCPVEKYRKPDVLLVKTLWPVF